MPEPPPNPSDAPPSQEAWRRAINRRFNVLGQAFRPSAPVDRESLFAGRNHEVASIQEAIQSVGQHGVIYGERGVGKTSLAAVCIEMASFTNTIAIRISCDGGDSFSQLWQKVIDELTIFLELQEDSPYKRRLTEAVGRCVEVLNTPEVTPGLVRIALRGLARLRPVVIFIDEFDQLMDSDAIALISNTIKTLSDNIEPVTLVPVGVADSLDRLLEGHLSAVRAIVQVRMPRMRREELGEIVMKGLAELEMTITPDARNLIEVIPRGLPQYAHLLAQEAARQALILDRTQITRADVMEGLRVGLAKLDRSLSSAYERATYSPKKTRFKEVLLACAVAPRSDTGDFAPVDIRGPYSRIIGESVDIDRFNPQLTALATTRDILIRDGEPRKWRYRFRDALMEPFVILQGLDSGMIAPEDFPH